MIFDDSVYVPASPHYPCLQYINFSALDSSGWIASASAWLPLTYDTIVLALTLNKTLGPIRRKTAGNIARVLLRDGILYYRYAFLLGLAYQERLILSFSVIFAVNAVLTIMIIAAPSGLQNITAQFVLPNLCAYRKLS